MRAKSCGIKPFDDLAEVLGARRIAGPPNHLHLVVEADDAAALGRGVGGLATRVARRINAALDRRGRVFADRYHAHELTSPTEVRRALGYVLENAFKHADVPRAAAERAHDPLSSAAVLAGSPHEAVSAPRSWLARVGWTRGRRASRPPRDALLTPQR